jgi:hypothetical protein
MENGEPLTSLGFILLQPDHQRSGIGANTTMSRHLRDSKAVARYAALTGSPEGRRRHREEVLGRAGCVPATRHESTCLALSQVPKRERACAMFQTRTADGRAGTRYPQDQIVAFARKLLIVLRSLAPARWSKHGPAPEQVLGTTL